MVRALAAIALLVACVRPVQPIPPSMPTAPVYCLVATVRTQTRVRDVVGCFETEGLCAAARELAISDGSVAGVTGVSECVEAEIR